MIRLDKNKTLLLEDRRKKTCCDKWDNINAPNLYSPCVWEGKCKNSCTPELWKRRKSPHPYGKTKILCVESEQDATDYHHPQDMEHFIRKYSPLKSGDEVLLVVSPTSDAYNPTHEGNETKLKILSDCFGVEEIPNTFSGQMCSSLDDLERKKKHYFQFASEEMVGE